MAAQSKLSRDTDDGAPSRPQRTRTPTARATAAAAAAPTPRHPTAKKVGKVAAAANTLKRLSTQRTTTVAAAIPRKQSTNKKAVKNPTLEALVDTLNVLPVMGHPHDAMSEDISIDGDNDDDDAYAPLRNGSEPEDYDALSEDDTAEEALIVARRAKQDADRLGARTLKVQATTPAPKLLPSTSARGTPRTSALNRSLTSRPMHTPVPAPTSTPARTPASVPETIVANTLSLPSSDTRGAKRPHPYIKSHGEISDADEIMSKPAKKHARILTSHYECILNYYPQIILEIAPKPKRAEVKLEKRLRKHNNDGPTRTTARPMPIAKAISIPSDIDDNDDDIVEMGSVICAPVSLPANNTQGYWKVHHPNQWPAISLALDYFKMRLIRYNPFAENETLRTYALSAFEDAFQDHQPFHIQNGMIETLIGAAASFRGNFKSAAQKEVIKLYKLDDPECDIKCTVEYLLDEWNFRFTDSSVKPRLGFMEHPAVVEVLKTIYTGNRPTKWATPQGRDMMSHFYPLMPEATMAFALTIIQSILEEYVSGSRIRAPLLCDQYEGTFERHLRQVLAFKAAHRNEWKAVSEAVATEAIADLKLSGLKHVTGGSGCDSFD